AHTGKTVLVVNHDLGESIKNFDDLILLNRQVVASGAREQVFNRDNLHRAYGGHVDFYAA
ncbi:MAG TPA: manganese ABC transporter ATP-binding protein, partial [Trichocoleus sp.]